MGANCMGMTCFSADSKECNHIGFRVPPPPCQLGRRGHGQRSQENLQVGRVNPETWPPAPRIGPGDRAEPAATNPAKDLRWLDGQSLGDLGRRAAAWGLTP